MTNSRNALLILLLIVAGGVTMAWGTGAANWNSQADSTNRAQSTILDYSSTLPPASPVAELSTISQQATGTPLTNAIPSDTPESYAAAQLQTTPIATLLTPQPDHTQAWNPPSFPGPIAHGYADHFWLQRPVTSDHNNTGLGYYPYGSNGDLNDLRIHHGVDFSNPIGVEIFSAGSGTVIWADKGHFNDYESITAYGNCVVIEHEFGYGGQRVYTLYAHMSAILVGAGDHVKTGQRIGLIGNTGNVTGPHVHFEVRIGRDSYFSVRNPVLWIAPYVGSGVIAGKIAFPGGSPVNDATIVLIDRSNGRIIQRTTSYAGFGVLSDDYWQENFVLSDIPAGPYLVTSRYDNITWSGEVEVVPGTVNWVDLTRYASSSTTARPTATP